MIEFCSIPVVKQFIERIKIFAARDRLKLITEVESWFQNGYFGFTPSNFIKLYILNYLLFYEYNIKW